MMATKAELQEENDELRARLESAREIIDDALGLEDGEEDDDEDEDAG